MAAKLKALQQWCKKRCEGYRDVEITNMTSSWKSGLAFCAIIHRYRPDLIDYDSLSKEDVYDNNKLAFDVAKKELDIAALLDAEDMVAMRVPDKLCIITYVAQYYNYFHNKEPVGGPGVKAKTAVKRPSLQQTPALQPESKKPLMTSTRQSEQTATTTEPSPDKPAHRRGTYGDTCGICKQKVYLLERHIVGSKLYHRRCMREQQRSQSSLKTHAQRRSQEALPPESGKNDTAGKKSNLLTTLYGGMSAYKPSSPTRQTGYTDEPSRDPHSKPISSATKNKENKYPLTSDTAQFNAVTNRQNGHSGKNTHSAWTADNRSGFVPSKTSASHVTTSGGEAMDVENSRRHQGYSSPGSNLSKSSAVTSHKVTANLSPISSPKSPRDKTTRLEDNANASPKSPRVSPRYNVEASAAWSPKSSPREKAMEVDLNKSPGFHSNKRQFSPRSKEDTRGSHTASPRLKHTASPHSSPREHFMDIDKQDRKAGLSPRSHDLNTSPGGSDSNYTTFVLPESKLNGMDDSEKQVVSGLLQRLQHVRQHKQPLHDSSDADDQDFTSLHQQMLPPKQEETVLQNRQIILKPSIANAQLKQTSSDRDTSQRNLPQSRGLSNREIDHQEYNKHKERLGTPTAELNKSSSSKIQLNKNSSAITTSRNSPVQNTEKIRTTQKSDKKILPTGILKGNTAPHKQLPPDSSHSESQMEICDSSDKSGDQRVSAKTAHGVPVSSSKGYVSKGSPTSRSEPVFSNTANKVPKSILKYRPDERPELIDNNTSRLKNEDSKWINSTVASSYTQNGDNPFNPSNKFSGFNIVDSVDLFNRKGPNQDDKANTTGSKTKTRQPKTAWQIEMEARQGIKQFEPTPNQSGSKSGLTTTTMLSDGVSGRTKSPSVTSPDEVSKPSWQVKAERRQAVRSGKYEDPEKATGLIAIRSRNKDSSTLEPHLNPTERGIARAKTDNMEVKQKHRRTHMVANDQSIVPEYHHLNQKNKSKLTPEMPKNKMPPTNTTTESSQLSPRLLNSKTMTSEDSKKTEWQEEAERRIHERKGKYVDPEKPVATQQIKPESGRTQPEGKAGLPSYGGLDLASVVTKQLGRNTAITSDTSHSNSDPIKTSHRSPPPRPPSPKKKISPTIIRVPRGSDDTSSSHVPRGCDDTSSSHDQSYRPPRPPRMNLPLESNSPTKPAITPRKSLEIKSRDGGQSEPDSTQVGALMGRKKIAVVMVDDSMTSPEMSKKKIVPDNRFSFNSEDFSADIERSNDGPSRPARPPNPPHRRAMCNRWVQDRPLPPVPLCNTPKRRVNAEARMATVVIVEQLEELEMQLRHLEEDGRLIEDKIRAASEDAMETDNDDNLLSWFDLVNKKNDLVRKEADLMYRQRQQELEDLHEELEYEYRCLLECPEHLKTASDKVRENALLQELLETVSQRNNIVDSMEEDRIRYIAEDQEIAQVMATIGPNQGKEKKKKKKKKNKALQVR